MEDTAPPLEAYGGPRAYIFDKLGVVAPMARAITSESCKKLLILDQRGLMSHDTCPIQLKLPATEDTHLDGDPHERVFSVSTRMANLTEGFPDDFGNLIMDIP